MVVRILCVHVVMASSSASLWWGAVVLWMTVALWTAPVAAEKSAVSPCTDDPRVYSSPSDLLQVGRVVVLVVV